MVMLFAAPGRNLVQLHDPEDFLVVHAQQDGQLAVTESVVVGVMETTDLGGYVSIPGWTQAFVVQTGPG